MITLNPHSDAFDRTQANITKTIPDDSFNWVIDLKTKDIPASFQNSNDRDVVLSVISIDEIDIELENVIYIPLTLSFVATNKGSTKIYYRNKFKDPLNQQFPEVKLEGYITVKDRDIKSLTENSYLKLEFINNDTGNKTNHQSFEGKSQDPHDSQLREHVSENENANGGLDLPVGVPKTEQVLQEKEKHHEYNPA